jgi:hypothetical protein
MEWEVRGRREGGIEERIVVVVDRKTDKGDL